MNRFGVSGQQICETTERKREELELLRHEDASGCQQCVGHTVMCIAMTSFQLPAQDVPRSFDFLFSHVG